MQVESVFKRHFACPHCPSSDAYAVYDDGHGYCFTCQTYDKTAQNGSEEASDSLGIPDHREQVNKAVVTHLGALLSIPDRGIVKETCKFYNVTQTDDEHFYPYGSGIKVRKVSTKDFFWRTKSEQALFGMDRFNAGGKAVTIFEGELDAMAGFQMTGSKFACVSVKNGASGAVKDCQKAFQWLDSFDSIVVCFDSDEPGQKAALEVAELFGGKVKMFKHIEGFKDACDYLKANKSADFVRLWWASEQYVPDGIIEANELREALKKPLTVAPVLYPWQGLNRMLYGVRPAELVTFTAGSGLGKSTILRELVLHILKNTNENVGLAFLEETPERTMRGLVGLELNKKLHLPDTVYDPSEIDMAYDSLGIGKRVFLWNHFGSNEITNVLNRLRYFVKALGCTYLVLDHLSILVSDQAAADERKNIDMVMTKLRTFVQEMNVSLLLVSHLKRPDGKSLEDGAVTSLNLLRGSGSIAQLSDAVISAERNSQAENIIDRNTTKVRVLKSRYTGYTGHACDLLYDDFTGRLKEIEIDNSL